MAITVGQGSPLSGDGGLTNLQVANKFVRIETAGARELVKQFQELASRAASVEVLQRIVRKASEPIFDGYKQRAREHEATGNLAASVTRKYKNYPEGAVAVVGPRQTGPIGDTPKARSGNHAWLVEFGTAARRPGTKGRRTYVNVHQMINGKMSRVGSLDDQKFRTAGGGIYFLMGSKDYRASAGGRPGYSRDFAGPGPGGDGREQHPITLKPGETIRGMPPQHIMEDTVSANGRRVLEILKSELNRQIMLRS